MLLLSVTVISMLACCCCAQSTQTREKWHYTQIANPQVKHDQECGRNKKSMICDPNNILTYDAADQIDKIIEQVANNTKCPCSANTCRSDKRGYMIGIVLVPHIMWEVEANGEERPKDLSSKEKLNQNLKEADLFTYNVLKKWDLGRCEEDLIIFYALYDNVLFVRTNEQSKLALSSDLLGDIMIDHRFRFVQGGDIFQGLTHLIADFEKVFNGEYKNARKIDPVTPANPQAVVGGASSLTSFYMLCVGALISLLILC